MSNVVIGGIFFISPLLALSVSVTELKNFVIYFNRDIKSRYIFFLFFRSILAEKIYNTF